MPDFSMFGPAQSGSRLAQQDWLSNQRKLGQLAEVPWKIRSEAASAQKAEMQLRDEQRWSHLLQTMSTPGGTDLVAGKQEDLAARFQSLAGMALKAGLPEQATKLSKVSAELRAKEASATRARAATTLDNLKSQAARLEMIGSLFGGVSDQQSWDRANMLFQVETGQVSPYTGLPYDPKVVKGILNGAIKAKDQVKLGLDAQDNASKERNRKSLEDHRKFVEDYLANKRRLDERREKRLEKQGAGKAVTSPAKAEVDQAINMIDQEYKDLSNADKVSAAFEVASEARQLRKQNPALDANEALNRAFLAAKQRGDFQMLVHKTWYGGESKKERFVSGGRSPDSAIPVPPEAKERIAGRYYYNSRGQIAQWTGKGWRLVSKPSELSTDNPTGIPPLLERPQ